MEIQSQFNFTEQEFKDIILKNSLTDKKLLELVFRRFLDKNILKTELYYFDLDYYSYLENHIVDFANANRIDDNNFYESLALRVYKIRNAFSP